MNIFISFKHEDDKYRWNLESLMINPNTLFGHVPISTREDYREEGPDDIRRYLRGLLRNSDVIICLVGKNTHSSPWVKYEVEVANSQQKPVIPIRIPETNGGIPSSIRRRNCIPWNRSRIQDEINAAYSI